MAKTRKIEFMNADDWQGLYVDGILVLEGHHLEADDVLTVLGIKYHSYWNVDEDWLNGIGRYPKKFSDIQFIKD